MDPHQVTASLPLDLWRRHPQEPSLCVSLARSKVRQFRGIRDPRPTATLECAPLARTRIAAARATGESRPGSRISPRTDVRRATSDDILTKAVPLTR